MKWYTVNVFYEGLNVNNPEMASIWEESILVIKAESIEEVKLKAKQKALLQETEYTAVDGTEKKWVFKDVGEITELDSEKLYDGMEIFSRYLKDSEAKSLLTKFKDE